MVHNGIEYGLMQAYAEGFELMYHSEFELDLSEIAGIWRYGSVVRSWLLELLHAAMEQHGDQLDDIAPYVEDSGEGRWTINEAINANVPVPAISVRALRPLRLASRDRLLGQGAGRAAEPVRRPRGQGCEGGEEGARPAVSSSDDGNPLLEGLRLRRSPDPCAIVIFGATGDLTRRKIFPALYALALRRLLPERFGVVGVARTEQTTKQWIAEMKKAVREHARDELRRAGLARAGRRHALRRHRLRRGRGARTGSSTRFATSTRSAAARATGSTTSPSRRPRSRRSSTSSASGGARRAGSG